VAVKRPELLVALEIDTPHGPARTHLDAVDGARGLLVLGHGAGGGVGARDLVAAADAARAAGLATALVEQPYRVAGRRSPAPAAQLDRAWVAVVEHLRARGLATGVLVVGGRSSGARVACRTAASVRADAVLCLAFPLVPPRRKNAAAPPQSRLPELDAVTVPTLVVQGKNDRFGLPPSTTDRKVVTVDGDHSLRTDPRAVATEVGAWLGEILEHEGQSGVLTGG